jgi:hypothetical protein
MTRHATDTPESGVSLTPKQTYRLQLKLQAALTRTVEILVRFEEANVLPNPSTLTLTVMTCGMLSALIDSWSEDKVKLPHDSPYAGLAVENIKRRKKESRKRRDRKRRLRSAKQALRENGHLIDF